MSKLDDLLTKLEKLDSRLNELSAEKEAILDEKERYRSMIDTINEVLKEHSEAQEEALATLYTKSESGQKLHDDDFRELGKSAGIDTSGFIEPKPEESQETAEVVNI